MRTCCCFEEARGRGPHSAGERCNDDGQEDVQHVIHPGELRPDPDAGDDADEVLALSADVEQAAAECERHGEAGQDQRSREDQGLLEVVCRIVRGRRVPPEEDVVVREGNIDVVVAEMLEPVQAAAEDDSAIHLVRPMPRVLESRGRAGREHDDAAHEECEEDRDDRCDDSARALVDGETLRNARRVRRGLGPQRFGGLWCLDVRAAGVGSLAHAAACSLPPPVIATPSSSSLTSGGYSPTIRPSYITRIRSESDRISSSSSDTSRIARPVSRSATSR